MRKWAKIVLPQLAIVAGLIVYFKVALPRIEKSQAATRATAREQAIESLFQSVTVEVGATEAAAGTATARPRRLRHRPDVDEVKRTLGAPNQSMTDFAGAQHLSWFGTRSKLVASFQKGRLYALTISDFAEEHGEKVFESNAQWQKF